MSMLDTAKIELGGLVSSLEKLNAVKTAKETEYFDEKAARYIIDTYEDCKAVLAEIVAIINANRRDFFVDKMGWKCGYYSLITDSSCELRLTDNFGLTFNYDSQYVNFKVTGGDTYYYYPRSNMGNIDVRDHIIVTSVYQKRNNTVLLNKNYQYIVFGEVNYELSKLPKDIAEGKRFSASQWQKFVIVANNTKRDTEEILAEFKAVLNGIISKRSKEIQGCESAKDSLAGMAEYEKISA